MENIDEIIAARLAKESLSQEEINSLDEWLSQSKSHKHIYSRLETMAERGKLLQEDHRDHNLVYHEKDSPEKKETAKTYHTFYRGKHHVAHRIILPISTGT